jgi:hypothetical protein
LEKQNINKFLEDLLHKGSGTKNMIIVDMGFYLLKA